MKKSVKNIVYIKENALYLNSGEGFVESDPETIHNISSYDILLDDNFFIYENLNIKVSSKKKIKQIIENYLITTYPKELVDEHYYAKQGSFVLIAIPKSLFTKVLSEYEDILKKAKTITTPFLETISGENSDFIYKVNNTFYYRENDEIKILPHIENENDGDNIIYQEDILNNILSPKGKLNIFENTGNIFYLKQFAPLIAVILLTYILFITGESFQYVKYKNLLNQSENRLEEIYRSAGVAGTSDPYGMLLYRAKGDAENTKIKITDILEKLSKSVSDNTMITKLDYKNEEMKIDGKTDELKTLENLESSITETFNQAAQIINTKKNNNEIRFSIRVGL